PVKRFGWNVSPMPLTAPPPFGRLITELATADVLLTSFPRFHPFSVQRNSSVPVAATSPWATTAQQPALLGFCGVSICQNPAASSARAATLFATIVGPPDIVAHW